MLLAKEYTSVTEERYEIKPENMVDKQMGPEHLDM